MLTANFLHRSSGFDRFQDRDDLVLTELASLHKVSFGLLILPRKPLLFNGPYSRDTYKLTNKIAAANLTNRIMRRNAKKIRGFCRVTLAFLSLQIAFATVSGQRLPLENYTTTEGLPHNSINKIVSDSRGFLWFCTQEGLSRFDGYSFTNYSTDQGLPHSNVSDFLETRGGEFWVGTKAGLVQLNPKGEPANRVVYSGGPDGGATPMFTTVTADDTDRRAQAVSALLEARDGTIWVGTLKGLYRLERTGRGYKLRPVEIGMPGANPELQFVNDLLEDRFGSVWVSSDLGLYRIWADGASARYTIRDGLPDEYVHNLLEDHRGQLWVGTRYGGFFRITADAILLLVGASAAAQQKLPPAPFIIADNNPVVIPPGKTRGTVTLEWDGGPKHPYAEVWVRVDQNDETFIVEQGRGIRNATVELGKSYVFKLSDANVLLAQISVTVRQGTGNSQPPTESGVSPRPTPAPMNSPDYEPPYAVNGKIRWKKAYGVVPVNADLQDSINNRCISFYVAAMDPRTNQPLRGDHSQMWPADDEGDYHVCRYALKLPTATQVRVIAQMGGDGLLPNPDPNPLFLTRAWFGGDPSQSQPPRGAMRAFTGSRYATVDRRTPRATIDFELYYAIPGSGNPK